MSFFLVLFSLVGCEDKYQADTASVDTAGIPATADTGTAGTVDDTGSPTGGTDGGTTDGGTDGGTGGGTSPLDTDTGGAVIDTGTGGSGSDTEDTGDKEDAPVVSWLSPLGGEYLYGTHDLQVEAVDDVLVVWVEYYVDGTLLGYDIDGEPWEIPWQSDDFAEGTRTLTAVAYDDVSESGEATIEVTVDRTPPEVTITDPADGADVSGTVTVAASVVEDNLDTVEFWVDSTLAATFGPGDALSWDWDVRSLPSGSYPIEVIATDRAGWTGSDSITVSVVSAPEVIIIEPGDGDTVSGEVTMTAEASDDGAVMSLDFLLDGAIHDSLSGSSPYTTTWDSCAASPGPVEITAEALDDEGLSGSDSITVTVDQPFEITLVGPSGALEPSELLQASLYDDVSITSVVWDLDGTALASTATADSLPGSVSCSYTCGCYYYEELADLSGFSSGTYTLRVTATNADGDVAVDTATVTIETDGDGDGFPALDWGGDDCDDSDDSIHPDADEICDGIDNDCDGDIDEDPVDGDTFYADGDSDGFGDAGDAVTACEEPPGYVSDDTDCDDSDDSVHPDADEICGDGIDNDCDGDIDEADGVGADTFYADGDSDGFGDAGDAVTACEEPPGYVSDDTDCDDSDDSIHPDADEICDGVDNDCDGDIDEPDAIDADDWFADGDGDGYGDADDVVTACDQPEGYVDIDTDCDDTDGAIHPDATEICDGIDNDCDGLIDDDDPDVDLDTATDWYVDADSDGFGDPDSVAIRACDEPPGGYVDDDEDCDDTDGAIHPDAPEICDGIDNDCDASTSEDGAVTLDGENYLTIQGALSSAYDGAVITVCDGTYVEALTVQNDVTIESLNGAAAVTINAASGGSVIHIEPGNDVVLEGLTLSGGSGTYDAGVGGTLGGGINAYTADSLTVRGCIIEDNTAVLGGGILGSGYASDFIEDTVIRNNVATNTGGGMFAFGVDLEAVEIDGNEADYGGGAYFYADVVTLDSDTIISNNTALIGGGLWVEAADLILDPAATISGNRAEVSGGGTGGGGGVYLQRGTLSGGIISGNVAEDYAGGVFAESAVAVDAVVIEDNSADYGGGGILFIDSNITVTDLEISGNDALFGGGVWAESTATELRDTTIRDNTASYGAGLLVYRSTDVTLRSSIINDNAASVEGGGVFLVGLWNAAGSTLLEDASVTSTTSNWGSGATDNSAEDIWVDYWDSAYSYGTSASFTCTMSLGGCF